MEEHPVPQNIASYEFRLVGDMTLKQFGYLAVGTVIAFILYKTRLPVMIKWPLILFSGFSGFAFAFIPIEERPLSLWLQSFVASIFKPTLYVWKKTPRKPEVFSINRQRSDVIIAPPPPSPDLNQLNEYLKTLPSVNPVDSYDHWEKKSLTDITDLLKQPPQAPFVPTTNSATKTPLVPPLPLPETKPEPEPPVYTPRLPIPKASLQANVLVGIVLDKYGGMIEGAIIEIRDAKGLPVRAFKTNKLGQFFIATPLEKGHYEIETDKPGHDFDIIKIEIVGKVVDPLIIRAKQWKEKYPEEKTPKK